MSRENPIVSVIIPFYNTAPHIERCISSVFNQSEKNIEVIAVDDHSTDHTWTILETLQHKHSNLHLHRTPQKSMAGGARNTGLSLATGSYICFVDSDDWIDTDFLDCMIKSIQHSESEISISGVKREYTNAKDSAVRYHYNAKNVVDGDFALTLLSRVIDQDISISAIVCNKMFRSEFLRAHNLRFIENSYNEDDVFMFIALLEAKRVSITNDTYYHLLQRRNSTSRDFSKKHITDLMHAFSIIRGELSKRNSFEKHKMHFYSFFEKCLEYLVESMKLSIQDDKVINEYFKFAYENCGNAISAQEFIEYCGNVRIEGFFSSKRRS